ncbi:hypothetical protein [Azospirillum largimobile]
MAEYAGSSPVGALQRAPVGAAGRRCNAPTACGAQPSQELSEPTKPMARGLRARKDDPAGAQPWPVRHSVIHP